MIGTTLGQYRIVERLGQGGMGAVYRALDDMLAREVAIKLLRPELAHRPEVVERFRTEAITLARLDHPNIARLHGLARHDAHLFMVMEYVPGDTLQDRLERLQRLPARDAVPLLCQLLDALHYAHGLGVVHRDIKPGNVIVRPDGRLKVTDFGIARVLGTERATRTGYMVGTLHYMAPEQIRGEEVDARTDLYAVGVLFYELLTGRVPFSGTSEYDVITGHLQRPVPPVRQTAPDAPLWVDALLGQAMAKTAASRFDSAERFRLALVDFSAGDEEEEAPTVQSTPGRPVPPTRIAAPGAGVPVGAAVGSGGNGAVPVGGASPVKPTRLASDPWPAASVPPGVPRAPAVSPAPVPPVGILARLMALPVAHRAGLGALAVVLVALPLAVGVCRRTSTPTPSTTTAGGATVVVPEVPPPAPSGQGDGPTISTRAPLGVQPVQPTIDGPAPRDPGGRPPAPPSGTPRVPAAPTEPATPAAPAETPVSPRVVEDAPPAAPGRTFATRRFADIVMLTQEGAETEEHDVVLSLEGQRLVIRDEDEEAVLRTLPYERVRDLLYSHTKKPSWRAGPNTAVGVLSAPVNIFRGARHWLTIQEEGRPPLILRLDKNHVPDLLPELEQRTGVQVGRRTEG